MRAHTPLRAVLLSLCLLSPAAATAQERLPWERTDPYASPSPAPPRGTNDAYRPGGGGDYRAPDGYGTPDQRRYDDSYRPPAPAPRPSSGSDRYEYGYDRYGDPPPRGGGGGGFNDDGPPRTGSEPYDRNYGERRYNDRRYEDRPYDGAEPPPRYGDRAPAQYSRNEILNAGHGFFGSISQGLAGAIEYAFQQAGRPNGYILGEDAGGAFVAGLRYGEGVLHTKDAGRHRVYWQGPSLGYDFGGEGSKTMVLVYNLRDISEIYNRFGGVQGSAYLVGGVSVQFQKYGDVVLAPIRAGVGLRLGANVGYLKYTRTPTWNPF